MADTTFGPNGWTPDRLGALDGKTFVITGATAGTGFQACRILLSKGARVVMLNRNDAKSQAAIDTLRAENGADARVSHIRLDLSDLNSVHQAADMVLEKTPQIDALICNAAIAQVPRQTFTKDGFESHLGTNHYGHFALCSRLFERIDASSGRIVVVSSLGYRMGLRTIQFDDMNWDANYHPNRTYCHSKLAQMMFAYDLQDRIAAAGRRAQVYVCHPGAARTSLIETSGSAMAKVMFGLMSRLPIVQSAERGAYPAVMCATEPNLKQRAFYGPTGFLETTGPVGRGTLKDFATDTSAMHRLWDISLQNTGIRWSI